MGLLYLLYIENGLFPTTAVQQRKGVDAVGCRTLFSELISMCVFDTLQIPSECIQTYRG